MNVAFVVHDFDAGFGQGRYGVELVRRLRERCEFTVYANTAAGPLPDGVRMVRVPASRWSATSTILTFLAASEILVRRDRPDVIHAQGLTCWQADVITGHVCNAARARAHDVAPRARWFSRLVTPVERAFYRQRRARHLIAVSRRLAGQIREHYGWARAVTVLHHGVDLEQFRPPDGATERAAMRARLGVDEGRRLWMFMGEASKGLARVIDQLAAFPGVRLVAITRSRVDDEMNRAARLGVAGRVAFRPYEPRPELALRAADAFVYPSDFDSFGMVVAEAMATGLPVVVGKDIGAAELVADGENGLLCAPADPASVAAALDRLERDPALACRLGAAARESARSASWDRNAAAVLAIYGQVLREKGAGR